jgi:hypothetical protein
VDSFFFFRWKGYEEAAAVWVHTLLEIGSVSVFRWRIYEEIHIPLGSLGRILSYLAVAVPGGPAEYEFHHILSTQRWK